MTEPREETVYRPSAPALRPFIDGYVGYRLTGSPPGIHRGLPSRHLTCIVSIGDAIDVVAQTDARQAPDRYHFALGGLQVAPALIARPGHEEGVAIELTPLGARAVLGVPAAEIWNTSLEANDVIGGSATELWERLNETPDWEGRFAACDAVLGRLAGRNAGGADPVRPEVRAAWRVLSDSDGSTSVAGLADHIGWSRRHLSLRFGDEFGLSPKLAARVMRFDRARWMLTRRPRPSFAEVAAACGYYDQPHLNRDFAELAGCSPGHWLATEIPSVQDGRGAEPSVSAA